MPKGTPTVTEIMKNYIRCRRLARILRNKGDRIGELRLLSMADGYFHSAKIVNS